MQRRPEIGIRMALGSERGHVVWLVLRGLAVSVGAGLAVGIGGAVLGTRFLADRLYGVAPSDPVMLATGAAVLAAAALIAGVIPARQAARVDPVESLHRQ